MYESNTGSKNFSGKIFQNLETMGFIKEPEGFDFVIQSPPLTDKERIEISEFIHTRKLQIKSKLTQIISKKRNRHHVLKMPNA